MAGVRCPVCAGTALSASGCSLIGASIPLREGSCSPLPVRLRESGRSAGPESQAMLGERLFPTPFETLETVGKAELPPHESLSAAPHRGDLHGRPEGG